MEDIPLPPGSSHSLFETFDELEKSLGAPAGSLYSMTKTDDWSLIIKAHALIEGAVSQLLADSLDSRLQPIFERLELGRVQTGKLEFAKHLELVSGEHREFIKTLSSLRNKLAHDLRHLNFSFESYLESLDANQKKSFGRSVARVFGRDPEFWARVEEHVLASPQFYVALGVVQIIDQMVVKGNVARWTREGNDQKIMQLISGELRQAAPGAYEGRDGT
jgi:hypothetical protein